MKTTGKYHIEKNTVQETLVIPLYGRKVCADHYPELFMDKEAERICEMLDYDFASKKKIMESPAGLFGALEVAQRHYDLLCEISDYLKVYPEAAVVNLGCGLDDSFHKADNGLCRGYNIDLSEVIEIRNELLGATDREENIGFDLNDHAWMNLIDGRKGAIFLRQVFSIIFKEKRSKSCSRKWRKASRKEYWSLTAAMSWVRK